MAILYTWPPVPGQTLDGDLQCTVAAKDGKHRVTVEPKGAATFTAAVRRMDTQRKFGKATALSVDSDSVNTRAGAESLIDYEFITTKPVTSIIVEAL